MRVLTMSATAPVSSTRLRTFSAHRGDAPGVHEHKCISVMRVLASAEQALCWPLWPVARPRPWVARRTHTPFSPRWAWPCGMVVQMEGTAPPETLRERSVARRRASTLLCALAPERDSYSGGVCRRASMLGWPALRPEPQRPLVSQPSEGPFPPPPAHPLSSHYGREFMRAPEQSRSSSPTTVFPSSPSSRCDAQFFFSHRRRPSARMPWVEFTHRSAILRWLQRWLERSTAKMGTSEAGVCDLFPPRESNSVPDPRALAWCSLPPSRLRW